MNDGHENGTGDTPVDFFVSAEGEPVKPVTARGDQTLAEALSTAGIETEDRVAYLGDDPDDIELDDPDDAAFGPVDLDASIASLGLGRHGHITCHRCRRIKVEVNYNGREVKRAFRPAVTVARLMQWAERRLGICADTSDDLVLEICGTDDRPRPEQRLGELVRGRECRLCFDLVPKERVNG